MCLGTQPGGNGGVLALGVDYTKDKRFIFTQLTDEQWWSINLNDIKFGGKSLGLVRLRFASQLVSFFKRCAIALIQPRVWTLTARLRAPSLTLNLTARSHSCLCCGFPSMFLV